MDVGQQPSIETTPETTPAEPPELSRGADTLLRLLRSLFRLSLSRGKGYVWPPQEELAERLGMGERTVRRHLSELEAAGIIKRVRTWKGNRYYFLDQASERAGTQNAPADEMASGDRPKWPDASGQNGRCAPAKMSGGASAIWPVQHCSAQEINTQQQQGAYASAAAAEGPDLFQPLEIREAEQALLGLDLSPGFAAEHAKKDHRLAIVVATWCAERFRDKTQDPVRNKPGFVRHALECPEAYGFMRVAGGDWIPPKQSGAVESTADRLKRIQREAAERRQRDNEAAAVTKTDAQRWFARSNDEWDKLPILIREAIKDHVRRLPKPPATEFLFQLACLQEMKRRAHG